MKGMIDSMKSNLVNSNFLKKLENLKLNSNVILNKGYSGARKSKSKGSSVEFSDFREYVPGDDFRKIDWNAYARFEKLFIKLFMEEREVLVNIFLDTSKSMDFGEPKKSLIAKQLALYIGYLSLSNMDRVNIYMYNDNALNDTGVLSGKKTFPMMVNHIENVSSDNKNDFFNYIKSRPYKKGISIVISDIFTKNFGEAVKYLSYMNQNIIVIHTLRKEEISPQVTGDMRFIDSETDEAKDISITSSILDAYQNTFKDYLAEIKEVCRKYGCMYALISNEAPIESIIFDSLIKAGILR